MDDKLPENPNEKIEIVFEAQPRLINRPPMLYMSLDGRIMTDREFDAYLQKGGLDYLIDPSQDGKAVDPDQGENKNGS